MKYAVSFSSGKNSLVGSFNDSKVTETDSSEKTREHGGDEDLQEGQEEEVVTKVSDKEALGLMKHRSSRMSLPRKKKNRQNPLILEDLTSRKF